MKRLIKIFLPIVLLLVVAGCQKKDNEELEKIADVYQSELKYKKTDKDIKLKIFHVEEDPDTYFIEEYNPQFKTGYYSLWDRKKDKKNGNIDQSTENDLYRKYYKDENLVYETTIDYANK